MPIAIGVIICLGSYFVARALARRVLGLHGVSPLSKDADDSYFQAPRARRIAWRLAGPACAYLVSVGLSLLSLRAGGETILTTEIDVLPDGPAAAAGLHSGDRVVAVEGVSTPAWSNVLAGLAVIGPAHSVSVSAERNGTDLSLTATTNASGRIGIHPRSETIPTPIGRALAEAVAEPLTTSLREAQAQWTLVTGQRKEDLLGPVGIVHRVSGENTGSGAGRRFALMLLAYPAALVWPLSLFVELLLTPRRRRRTRGG
jgi:membrane-associated protease RseP (regulator of RpoE activity)